MTSVLNKIGYGTRGQGCARERLEKENRREGGDEEEEEEEEEKERKR